jgi:hypothetical protein
VNYPDYDQINYSNSSIVQVSLLYLIVYRKRVQLRLSAIYSDSFANFYRKEILQHHQIHIDTRRSKYHKKVDPRSHMVAMFGPLTLLHAPGNSNNHQR